MASLVDLCAAMRSAGVTSVWLAVQRLVNSRATWYVVCSDAPIALRVDDPIYDRVTGYDHIDGLTRYTVSITARSSVSRTRMETGSGLWPLGTLGVRPVGGSSSFQSLTFTAMYSPKPLDIKTFTPPRTGATYASFWTNSEYRSAISTRDATIASLRAMIAAAAADLNKFRSDLSAAMALTNTQDQPTLIRRAAALLELGNRAGRVVFSYATRPIRFGGY